MVVSYGIHDGWICPLTLLQIHLLLIAIYSSYTLYLLVAYYEPQLRYGTQNQENSQLFRKLICGMPSAFHGVAVVKWNLALTFANVLSVIIYMITWFIVRRLGGAIPYSVLFTVDAIWASAETRRLFRSICIVMVIDVAGLTITTLLANLLMAFDVRGGVHLCTFLEVPHRRGSIRPALCGGNRSKLRNRFQRTCVLYYQVGAVAVYSDTTTSLQCWLPQRVS